VTRLVALLRGINVGKAKRVAMADLRALMEDLGHTDVATVLMSGNVVFSSSKRGTPALAKGIEEAIRARLGMEVRVLVRTAAEVQAVLDANPFVDEAATAPNRLQVTFFDGSPDRNLLRPVLEADWSPEAVALGRGVLYAWQPDGMTGSKLGEALTKVPGPVTTTRNLATLQKLLAKA
jgi:uncharacterized protein (DUF1697 family)